MADTLAAALWLAERHLHVFELDHPELPECAGWHKARDPCDGQRGKHPSCKWSTAATTDRERITAMFAGATRNIGIACGASGLLVVDEDVLGELARFCESIGQTVPDTFRVRTGKGWHYYFCQPAGAQLGNAEGALRGYGVNVRGVGGYVVGPGSVHASGEIYLPADVGAEILPCPDWLVATLTGQTANDPFAHPDGAKDHSWWRDAEVIHHPDRHNALVAAAGYCRKVGLSKNGAVPTIRDVWRRCCPGTCCRDEQGNPAKPYTWERALARLTDVYDRYPAGDPRPEATARTVAAGLSDAFWTTREHLRHIRDAAWSRGRSAEAVLGVVLARVAADSGYVHKLPPLVGARCGLDLIVALTATSGGGKSSAKAIGAELLPARRIDPICDEIPPGSGEGLIDVLFDMVTENGPDGKATKVKRQTRYNAFVYADEGEVLAATARRNTTSTLLPNLRSIFSGAVLGQANASEERKRRVPAGRYAYGVVVAIQPAGAGPLFDDIGVGTPQRILWLPARTDTPPPDQRPEWPGPIPRGVIKPRHDAVVDGMWVDLLIHQDIAGEIKANDYHRHVHGCDPLDEHRDLVRLKVAGNLAALDARDNVDLEDWSLAGMVTDLSDATRGQVLASLAAEHKRANTDRGRADGERQAVADDVLDERAMAAAKRQAVNRVVKHHREHPEGSCPRRCVDRAIASKYRQIVSVDDILDRAVGEDQLAVAPDGRYAPGKRTT